MSNDQAKVDRRFGKDLTSGSIPRHVISFSLPMLMGSVLQTAYAFVNAIWVGQFLGTSALAAVTVSFPVVFLLMAIGMGITMATNILVSQNYGARRFRIVRKVTDTSTALVVVLSAVLLVLGEIFAPAILHLMDTPANVLPAATCYLRIFLLSMPLSFGMFLTRNLLQGIGDSKTPIYFQSAAVLMTAALDPLLMFGWLGFPRLGLNGTAWASVFSQMIALFCLLFYLWYKKNPVAPIEGRLKFDFGMAVLTMRIGLPTAIQQSFVSISMLVVTGIINSFGETATAAFGVASRIDQIAFLPALTFSMAVASLSGQNIGAKKFDRVTQIFWWGNFLSACFTLASSILALTVPHLLMQIFTTEPMVVQQGETYLRCVGGFYIFFSVMFISNGVINGAGHTFITTLIALTGLWLVRVPLAYYLAQMLKDVRGVWYAIAVGFFASMSLSLLYYFSGRWKKPLRPREKVLLDEPVGAPLSNV